MRARWLFLALLLGFASTALAQQWYSMQTAHLISYSEGNDRGARDAALRGEQLIAVFGELFHRTNLTFSTPLRVQVVSSMNGSLSNALVRTPAANFVIVTPSESKLLPMAARSIAVLTLEDNYPRAQPWFDSGIASYLAGVRFTDDQMELGAPPPDIVLTDGVLPRSGEWIPLAKLFEINDLSRLSSAQRATFEAESWAVVQWLIGSSRLAQAGVYLNAVQSRGTTPERALAEAFSMGFDDLDREVRESLNKLSAKKMPAPRVEVKLFRSRKISAADAHVFQATLSLFGPEADRTRNELVAFMRQNQENVEVHRALAWAYLSHHDLDNAVEHIRRALALDDSDPAMHYLYARWVNQGEEDNIRIESAEPRMSTELKAALKLDPNYAAALELLGLAELSSGNTKPALANLQRASALRPRSDRYYLNLARAYEAAGNLDAARNLVLYARAGSDVAVSAEAAEMLNELGHQKKRQQQWEAMGMQPDAAATPSKYDNLQDAIAEDEKAEAAGKSPGAAPDTRKTEYMKGRIVGVECGAAPQAILRVSSAGRTWQMHVADRNTIVLIGVDHFDCTWHDTPASINYKRSGNLQGELVSLETH
jgi:tetratricopeptide (TPR) repeat protein